MTTPTTPRLPQGLLAALPACERCTPELITERSVTGWTVLRRHAPDCQRNTQEGRQVMDTIDEQFRELLKPAAIPESDDPIRQLFRSPPQQPEPDDPKAA
ncbi:MAG: hypothetical protein ACRDRL_33695 [Sciscionella sp.]